jgi:hypothetical protein
MTCVLLQIEEEKDDVIGMISFQGKKTEMCRLQHTKSGLPKLFLTRSAITYNRIYNALPYNYKNFPNVEGLAPMFQTEIDGLTRSNRCFTLEELEMQ